MRQTYRQTEINRLRADLEQNGFPRLKMLLIVGITGGSGFLASYLMLRCCVTSMALRYPIAIAVAYLVFLFLLWLWLRTSVEDYTDFPDLSGMPSPCDDAPLACPEPASATTEDGGALSETFDAAAGADEFAIPLLVLLLVAALLLSSLWVVYSAPALFAELLLDGALAAGLYRKLRGLDARHWLTTALRRTIWPFAATAVIVSLCGMGLQAYYPTDHSLGDVIRSGQQTQDHSPRQLPLPSTSRLRGQAAPIRLLIAFVHEGGKVREVAVRIEVALEGITDLIAKVRASLDGITPAFYAGRFAGMDIGWLHREFA